MKGRERDQTRQFLQAPPWAPFTKNLYHLLHVPVVSGIYRQPCTIMQYSTPNRARQTQKKTPKDQLITTHSTGYPQDTKPLHSNSGNQAKMLLKSHIGIKCHPNTSRSSYSFRTVPPIVNGGGRDWGCIVRDL